MTGDSVDQRPRLLAVDDDAPSAELVARVAERCGYEAFATTDSRGVINLVTALRPDVVALDISMPHVDAIDVLRMLAQHHYSGRLVIVSGHDEHILHQTKRSAELLGLHSPHLQQKPLNFARLRQILTANQSVGAH